MLHCKCGPIVSLRNSHTMTMIATTIRTGIQLPSRFVRSLISHPLCPAPQRPHDDQARKGERAQKDHGDVHKGSLVGFGHGGAPGGTFSLPQVRVFGPPPHLILLFGLILALFCFATGCKGSGATVYETGSTSWQSLWQWFAASVGAVLGWISGEWLWALLLGLGAPAIVSHFQEKPAIVSEPVHNALSTCEPPPPSITTDPLGFGARLLELFWSGLWLVLVAGVVLAILYRNRSRIWAWITRRNKRVRGDVLRRMET